MVISIILLTVLFSSTMVFGADDSKFSFYGFVKAEVVYDNTSVVKGDWLLYVPSGNTPDDDNKLFTMNARHTRLGVKINGGETEDGIKVTGLVEADFAGGFPNSSTAARQPNPRLRHAWVQLAKDNWSFRAGQDWALIASPFPTTTSFVVGAGKGNLWMRYPQMKFTYKMGDLTLAGSMNRPMAGNTKYDEYAGGDFDMVGDGEETGLPWWMGRASYKVGPATVSASGHYGTESIADKSGTEHDVTTYSLNADAVAKFGPLSVTGRFFTGENLNSFFGGVFQGYVSDSTSVTSLPATGGWGQVKYTLNDKIAFVVGGGTDMADEDLLANGNRTSNKWLFANVTYSVTKAMFFQFEYENLTTTYKGDDDGKAGRFQVATYLKF